MPRRKKNLPDKTAYALDVQLLELAEKGRRATNPSTGGPLLGEDGEPVYTQPTAADLRIIRDRVRDCGVGETEVTDPIARAMADIAKNRRAPAASPGGDDA